MYIFQSQTTFILKKALVQGVDVPLHPIDVALNVIAILIKGVFSFWRLVISFQSKVNLKLKRFYMTSKMALSF
jgi:hypothetical protein